MFLKKHVDILTTLWLGALYTFKIWLDKYLLNLRYRICEKSMKIFVSKKVNNNLDITSVWYGGPKVTSYCSFPFIF